MNDFSDNEYNDLISNLIREVNYVDVSNMNKMSSLRKHGEIIVRKILNIGNETQIMLGQIVPNSSNNDVRVTLSALDADLQIKLIDVVKVFNRLVRDGSHTQKTSDYTNNEVKDAEDKICELYAILFIKYFIEIGIGIETSPHVLRLFSLLPPIIRFKVWSYLFEKNNNNVIVADKYCLSIIKKDGKEEALNWLNNNEAIIRNMSYPSSDEINAFNEKRIVEIAPGKLGIVVSIDFSRFSNMYDLLKNKIKDPRTSVNESGKMYKSFDEALVYYRQVREGYANIDDTKKLLELMDFVYIGRRESIKPIVFSVDLFDKEKTEKRGI